MSSIVQGLERGSIHRPGSFASEFSNKKIANFTDEQISRLYKDNKGDKKCPEFKKIFESVKREAQKDVFILCEYSTTPHEVSLALLRMIEASFPEDPFMGRPIPSLSDLEEFVEPVQCFLCDYKTFKWSVKIQLRNEMSGDFLFLSDVIYHYITAHDCFGAVDLGYRVNPGLLCRVLGMRKRNESVFG